MLRKVGEKMKFNIVVPPKPKQGVQVSPAIVHADGSKTKVHAYQPKAVKDYEDNIRAQIAMQIPKGHIPWDGATRLSRLVFKVAMPKGYETATGKDKFRRELWKALHDGATVYYLGKPDFDNLCKTTFDAVKELVMMDDAQICSFRGDVEKVYTLGMPGIEIEIEQISQIEWR